MLSVKECMTLEVAGLRWHHPGRLDSHIRETFSEPPRHFHRRVDRLLDEPDALAEYPQLVMRLRRIREQRRALRLRSA